LFDGEDRVSVYSLAANAWEVVDALSSREGIETVSNQTRENLMPGKDLARDYINSPYRNFFKHADRDPDEELDDFSDSRLDSLIYLAVEDYMRLSNKGPIEFQVFQLWHLLSNLEKVRESRLLEIQTAAERIFGQLDGRSRSDKLSAGKRALEAASKEKGILDDPRTETEEL